MLRTHVLLFAAGLTGALGAQQPQLAGKWQLETPEGPQVLIVRADSSASFGEETVQWRAAADTIYILFGDEWVGYNYALTGDSLTLSGGDLEEPVTLTRVGPVEPRGPRRSAVARTRVGSRLRGDTLGTS